MFFDSPTNHFTLVHTNNPRVEVDIKIIKRQHLIVESVLKVGGYVIMPFTAHAICLEEELKAPPGCAIMVSGHQSHMYFNMAFATEIALIYIKPNSSRQCVSYLSLIHI
eukprot:TRINITY_DN70778_c1_g1_i1.p1 TRINITY_DN70778_c1_g1~~TRINITY_DN70778_c1_g1_i1.p1  ORF type:complete len:120 (-),score=14.39 TRINITY_DN70778_c1_g1_i1:3-329(-)